MKNRHDGMDVEIKGKFLKVVNSMRGIPQIEFSNTSTFLLHMKSLYHYSNQKLHLNLDTKNSGSSTSIIIVLMTDNFSTSSMILNFRLLIFHLGSRASDPTHIYGFLPPLRTYTFSLH